MHLRLPRPGYRRWPRRPTCVAVLALLVAPLFLQSVGGGAIQPLATAEYPLGSWMMFQGGPEHLGQAQTAIPPNGRVVWTYLNQSSDKPEGGAVVSNGTVYAPLGRDLTALNLSNGSKLWSFRASGPIQTTPALWGDTAFFGTVVGNEVHNFFAVNTTSGQLRWSVNESSSLGDVQFVKSSPAVSGGLVYYGSWTYWFYARNASNGSVEWSVRLASEVAAAPAVSNGLVFVATKGIHDTTFNVWIEPPRLYALDAVSGAEAWNRSVPEGHLLAAPVVDGDLVYVTTGGFSYGTPVTPFDSGYVLAINTSDGGVRWSSPDIGRTVATPALAGRTLYVGTAGEQSGGRTGTTARLRALDLDNQGAVAWSISVGLDEAIESPPVVVLDGNGTATYVAAAGGDGTVGMWLATGVSSPLWSFSLPQDVVAPLSIVSELVVVPCLDGGLYAFGARPDLAVRPSDITLSDPTPHVGEPVDVEVTIHNLGDKAGSGDVSVYVNNTGARALLFERAVVNLSYQGGGVLQMREPYTFGGAGNITLEVEISNVTPTDGDLTNDRAAANVTVLPSLNGWGARYSDAANSNFFETATPENGLPRIANAFTVEGNGMLALDGQVVYAQGAVLWSVSASDASTALWSQAPSAGAVVGTPALSGSVLLAVTNDSRAWFIDPDGGAVLGSAVLPAPPSASPVPLAGGFLVPCSDRLVSLSLANRSVEREFQPISVPPMARPALATPPVVTAGTAFVVSSVGELHAFDLATGVESAGFPVTLRAPSSIPPVAGTNFVFAVNGSSNISAFSTSPLSPVPAQEFTFSEPISGPMAFAYGRLFVSAGARNLSIISPASGTFVLNATLPVGADSTGVLAVANNTVFLGNQTLFAVSAASGSMLWSYPFMAARGTSTWGSAAIARGLLHVQTRNGELATFGAIPGLAPVANISRPFHGQTVRVGEVITFSANGSFDPEGTTLSYTWRFGDGEGGSGSQTTHQYAFTSPQLQVTLIVQDEQGLIGSSSISIQTIDNAPPSLGIAVDEVSPDPLDGPYTDDTLWTFTVYYADPNDDAPAYVRLHLTNETDGVKEMSPRDPGNVNFSSSVAYVWTGPLSSAVHYWNFSTSDGLAEFSTVLHGPAVRVYRVEVDEQVPVSYRAQYIGQGNSTPYTSRLDPPGPTGLGVLTRFRFDLPPGSQSLLYLNLTVAYNLTSANLEDFNESKIGLYWYDEGSRRWIDRTVAVDTAAHTVTANVTQDGIFGVFGELFVTPLFPLPVIDLSPEQTVFFVGEDIEFSGARSRDPNSNDSSNTSALSFFWEFDDGTNQSGRTAVHRYGQPGTYNITLRVTNDYGQSSQTFVVVSVRTQESTSTFIAIVALLVGALMLFFLLSPVFRKRTQSPAEVNRRQEELRKARELTRPRAPPPGRGPGGKKGSGALSDDERRVVDELDDEFHDQVKNRRS